MDSSERTERDDAVSEEAPLEDGDDATPTPPADEELPLDVVFEVLKNERRRLVLEYLRRAEDSVTIGELAEHIAAHENGITPAELNAQQRKRVYIGLYQCHLPKMDDADAVAFNQGRGIVELGESAEVLYEYLDSDADVDDDGHLRQYTAFSIGGGLAFLFAHATGAPMLPELVVFGLLLGAPAVAYFADRPE